MEGDESRKETRRKFRRAVMKRRVLPVVGIEGMKIEGIRRNIETQTPLSERTAGK
jgi:hypothetical protein